MHEDLLGKRVKILSSSEYYSQSKAKGTVVKGQCLRGWVCVKFDDGYYNTYRPGIDLDFNINRPEKGSRY